MKAGGEGDDRGWDGWMASLTQWTWVWANFSSWTDWLNWPRSYNCLLLYLLYLISSCLSNHLTVTALGSVQFISVAQSCPTLCDPMTRSTPGLPVHHQLPEFTQTHVHRVGDAIQPSYPLSSASPPAPNPSQHQGVFQWVHSSHEVALG